MIIKTLYVTVIGGKTTASIIEPQTPYTTMYRVIADEGKRLTNGTEEYTVIDTDSLDGWYEVADSDAEEILNILLGGAE